MASWGPFKNSRGVSLVELVVGLTIMTITIAAGIQSFRFITQAVQQSRTKLIAINLAQEKMETLKNLSYFQLLVTTNAHTDINYGFQYDIINYSSETITLWGLPAFTRAVYVTYVNYSTSTAVAIPPTSTDPGMKEVTVYVMWQKNGEYKYVSVNSFFSNPLATTMDSGFAGTVTDSSGNAVTAAYVQVIGNKNWSGYADINGNYSFQVAHGTYSLLCSSAGYYDSEASGLVAQTGLTTTQNFTITKISSGSIMTDVWISSNLLVSNVIASSNNFNGTPIEVIELYNPTTYTWTIADSSSNPTMAVYYQQDNNSSILTTSLTYVNRTIIPLGYYLISSTNADVTINGTKRSVDAYYYCGNAAMAAAGCALTGNDIIKDATSGGVGVGFSNTGALIDKVAWTKTGSNCGDPSGAPLALTEGQCISVGGGIGPNSQLVRMSAPGSLSGGIGRAYDTNNNYYNFFYFSNSIYYPAYSTTDRNYAYTGTPAYQAFASASDGMSLPVTAVTMNQGNYEYARVFLTNVTTGTWSVNIASGSFQLTINTVTVTSSGSNVWIPNATTISTWVVSGQYDSILISTASGGYIQGYVYGAAVNYWTPLSNVLINCNGYTGKTTSSGYFFMNVASGTYTVNANYNGNNAQYISQSVNATISAGQVTNVPGYPWFHLAQAAVMKGYVTNGTGALPGIVIDATDGTNSFQGSSDLTGYFYVSAATSAASYTLTPELLSQQSYTSVPSPLTSSLTTPNTTVFVGTITVSGGMGTIMGTVKSGSSNITTGVLIIASQATIGDPPSTVYASSAAALSNPLYSISSQADGTYSLPVPAGSYYIRAFYPVVDLNKGTVSYTHKDLSGVLVTGGQTTQSENFSW